MSGSHNESIYNIIPPKQIQQEKPPMYRSKHNGKMPATGSTFHPPGTSHPAVSNVDGVMTSAPVPARAARTFGGVPGTQSNNPTEFMKKAEKTNQVPSLLEVKRTSPDTLQPSALKPKLKPSVPKKDDKPVMNLVTSKNFVVANAVETILAAPKKVSVGAKDYLQKEDYGKTPAYLGHIKSDIDAELDYIRQLEQQREDEAGPQVRPMDENERQNLVDGLKAKWEQVNTEYQATTHLTKLDTIGKTKRKERYEAELSQIEKDIEKLNRKTIFIGSQ